MGFLARVLINALAILLATWLIDGFDLVGSDTTGGLLVILLVVSALFGVINAVVKPIVKLLALPLYILTLGLFTLVVNALMLLLTAWVTEHTDWGLRVDGFWVAVWAGLIVSIASLLVSAVTGVRRR